MRKGRLIVTADLDEVELMGRPLASVVSALWRDAGVYIVIGEQEPSEIVINACYPCLRKETIVQWLEHPDRRPLVTSGGSWAARWSEEQAEQAEQGWVLQGTEGLKIEGEWEASRADRVLQLRAMRAFSEQGVRFADPVSTHIDAGVQIAQGAKIGPGVSLHGQTKIAEGAQIQAGCWLLDTTVGQDSVLKPYSVCEGAVIGQRVQVGPMAHLREGTRLEDRTKVGNFVETKNASLGQGAKASHLSYLGDADIGPGANIGAGTITCNYDGFSKHQTVVGAQAFVGSNTSLVAPVTLGVGCMVGAGSTLSSDVPDGALAVERSEVRVLKDKAHTLRQKYKQRATKE